jgi:ABC-2 type transport system permease protein
VAIGKVKAYIAKGGNLLVAAEPGRQELLNPLLKTFGLQLMDGMLKQPSEDNSTTVVLPNLTKAGISLSKILNKSSIDSLPVAMNGVAGLSYHDTSGFYIQPILVTKAGSVENTYGRNPDLDIAGEKTTAHIGSVVDVSPAVPNNNEGTYNTAVSIVRQIHGREQRIVVTGDADFMSNSELKREKTSNFYFSMALFSWLDYGQFPVNTSRPESADNRVTIDPEGVTVLKIMYIYLLPGLILLFAAIFLIRRKRR